jgi:amino acid efflux transporter
MAILPLVTRRRRDRNGVMTNLGTIGLWPGTALYVCAVLGAGVLVLPAQVASLAGPASLIAWAFSILLSVPLALTFARLAATYPDAGGVGLYAGRAFGEKAGAVAGWWYFVAGSVGQTIVPLTAG